MDGIDFDFEKSVRITEAESQNLNSLVDLILAHPKFDKSKKVLSLTTYHVGADPVNCGDPTIFDGCSYIEPSGRSGHCGEVISLLEASKNKFNQFNVMAYDAGQNFLY